MIKWEAPDEEKLAEHEENDRPAGGGGGALAFLALTIFLFVALCFALWLSSSIRPPF